MRVCSYTVKNDTNENAFKYFYRYQYHSERNELTLLEYWWNFQWDLN